MLMLLSLTSFMGITIGLGRTVDERYLGFTPIYACALVVFIGLLGLWTSLLTETFVILTTLGLLIFSRQLFVFLVGKNLNFPFILFLFLAILLALKTSSQTLVTWDDFSHWGIISRDLFLSSSVEGAYENTQYLNYPPGSAIFQFFFLLPLKIFGEKFVESVAIFASGLISLCAVYPLLWSAWRADKMEFFFTLTLALFLVFAPGNGLRTLMVDHLLGLVFGILLLRIWLGGLSKSEYIFIGFLCGFLYLIKSSGVFLCFVILVALALSAGPRDNFIIVERSPPGVSVQKNIFLLYSLLPLFFTFLLWSDVRVFKEYSAFQTPRDYFSILGGLFDAEGLAFEIRGNFLRRLLPFQTLIKEGRESFSYNKTAGSIILSLGLFLFLIRGYSLKSPFLRVAVVAFVGLFLHAVGLLILYQQSFSPAEARVLHSFDRYMGQYLVGLHILLLGVIATRRENLSGITHFLLLCGVFVSTVSFSDGKALGYLFKGSSPMAQRELNRALASSHQVLVHENTKVLVLWQCQSGLEPLVFRFDMHPAIVITAGHLGPPCSKGIQPDLPPSFDDREKFRVLLSDVRPDYVFVGLGSAYLSKLAGTRLQGLSADSSSQLFRLSDSSSSSAFERID